MTDLSIAVGVSRTDLGLGTLSINDGNYKIMRGGLGPGGITWRRQTTSSPFTHGVLQTNAVKEETTMILGVRVKGSSEDDCQDNIDILLRAFEQYSYFLSADIGGHSWVWQCYVADSVVGDGGAIQPFHMMAHQQEVTLSIPRNPIPYSGPT